MSSKPSLPSTSTLLSQLTSPTTTVSTLSSLLATLSQITHPPPISHPLLVAIERHLPFLSNLDLLHAVTILTHLAARNDTFASQLISDSSAVRLIRICAPRHDALLRDSLRRLSVILGIRAEEYWKLVNPNVFRARYPRFSFSKRPVRILTIDGGGVRALVAIQCLKRIEKVMGCSLAECFDLIGGTSCGGVLAMGIGLLGKNLDDIENIFKQSAKEIFTAKRGVSGRGLYQASKVLLFSKGMYDTKTLWKLYEKECGNGRLFEYAAGNGVPRVFALSTQMKTNEKDAGTPRVYLHANYRVRSRYSHGSLHRVCDALKATTAAPIYFDTYVAEDGESFCDGGVLVNNPAGVGVHEARQLWPERPIGVVVSVGTGMWRAEGEGGLVRRVVKAVLESATDTEGVHHAMEDLMEDGVYFRVNAELKNEVGLNESRMEVLEEMINVGKRYAEQKGRECIDRLCGRLRAIGKHRYGVWRGVRRPYYARL